MSIWKNEHNIVLYIWLSPPRYPSRWIVFISGYKSSYYQPIKNRTPKFVIHTHVNIFLKLRLCVLIKKIFFSKWSELVLNLMHFEKLLDFFFQSALPYCCLRWTINVATYPFTSNLVPRRFFHSIHLSQSTSDRAFLLIFCWASVCPCVIFFHIFDFFPRTTELISTKLDTNHPYVKGSKVVYFKE